MKIAVVHNLRPGGAKRALFEQVKKLTQNHQLDLYTFTSSSDNYFPLKKIVKNYYEIDYTCPEHFPASVMSVYRQLPKAYRKMAGLINTGKYDLVYVFPCYLTQAPYILKYLSVSSVYFCTEPKREFYEKIPRFTNRFTYALTYPFRYFIKYIDFYNLQAAGKIVTLSRYNRTNIKKIYRRNSVVVSLGVDPEIFYPLNIPKENIVLSVGNFTLLKGHDFIIRSLALIPLDFRPQLIITGFGGHEKSFLHKLAEKLNVQATIIDSPDDCTLNQLYNKSSLLAFAALQEPLGLVVLEALAAGLKIIAVKTGGVPEILTKKNLGILVNRDEKKFARTVLRELRKKDKKESIMSRRNYIINNWSWLKSVKELEKVLFEAK